MCGRFTMTRRDRSELAAMLGVPESGLGDYVPRFNIAPTQPYFILKTKYESREAIPATWGLVNSWAKDASRASMCINAKAETVDKLPSFREAFEKRRCVVPADGFYEWRGPKARREPLCGEGARTIEAHMHPRIASTDLVNCAWASTSTSPVTWPQNQRP
jgi:putative SOS response-associated peptidase YedK